MTFSHLSTRLAVLFGTLFAAVLLAVSMVVFFSVRTGAHAQVNREFAATVDLYKKLWTVSEEQLSDNAQIAAKDFGFRSAVATEDAPTIESALGNLSDRLDLKLAGVVLANGTAVNLPQEFVRATDLQNVLEANERSAGMLELGGRQYLAVSEPVLAPNRVGWVIFGTEIGSGSLSELESLSTIDLHAQIARPDAISRSFGNSITSATPLDSFLGTATYALVLDYPMSKALAPYRGMFAAIVLAGAGGLILLGFGASFVARTVTSPIAALDAAAERLGSGEAFELEVQSQDEVGRLAQGFLSMAERIAVREADILKLSITDPETELPNRRALMARINELNGQDTDWCVAAFGIERFETIRDVIGQDATNLVVTQIAKELANTEDASIVGRLSSAVLCVVFKGIPLESLEQRIRTLGLTRPHPVVLSRETVDVQLTAGLSDSRTATRMDALDTAVAALRQARCAQLPILVFDEVAFGDPSGTLSLMSDMIAGLSDDSIFVHYQPKLNCKYGRIESAEALVRWTHPRLGRIAPDRFITIAEETGHIRPLTEHVIRQVLQEQKLMAASGLNLSIAVNLSGRLVGDDDFIEWLLCTLEHRSGLSFEITETAVISDFAAALRNLNRLRAAGYETSIDDYGVGLSSLSYLKQIPASELKIDKHFIENLEPNSADALLVKSTIDLAHRLGMKVTCEGVEDQMTLDLLRLMGADFIQGFFISKPMPSSELVSISGSAPKSLYAQ